MSIPGTLSFPPLNITTSWPKRAQEFVIDTIKNSSSQTPKWNDIARRLNNHMARNKWRPKIGKQVRERYCEHLDPEV